MDGHWLVFLNGKQKTRKTDPPPLYISLLFYEFYTFFDIFWGGPD